MNSLFVSERSIVIDPISGRAMLGSNSIQDLNSGDYPQDRVRKFMKDQRLTNRSQMKSTRNMVVCKNIMTPPDLRNSFSKVPSYESSIKPFLEETACFKQVDKSRNISTEGIDGAIPRKFRHKNKKLFIDRKEILSVLGGTPGEYHGFHTDRGIGGTFNNCNNFWDERGILENKFSAGARLPQKNFQRKRKIQGASNLSSFGTHSKSFSHNKGFNIKDSSYQTNNGKRKNIINGLKRYKNLNKKLPNLREHVQSPNLQKHKVFSVNTCEQTKSPDLGSNRVAKLSPFQKLSKKDKYAPACIPKLKLKGKLSDLI
ncbi:unnamed protein product [Moneuplotes crassus]|uniref:Uncharacterized protein n=1 Tax=Euplotes crassus TaxID=5936 RepID=A0AAD1XM18_EUPCR|nr:unnamed protein product [Moneuplotes crassus]